MNLTLMASAAYESTHPNALPLLQAELDEQKKAEADKDSQAAQQQAAGATPTTGSFSY